MNILSAVKSSGATRTNAVIAESLNSFLFEGFVGVKIVEVIGAKVNDGSAIGQFRLGADWTTSRDDRSALTSTTGRPVARVCERRVTQQLLSAYRPPSPPRLWVFLQVVQESTRLPSRRSHPLRVGPLQVWSNT